ncbi:MAG: hypothetical protein AAFV93_10375, partial [Chloroflexota bacterium]
MLRGIRWQLLALFGSIILFSVVLGLRFLSPSTEEQTTQTPTATMLPATATIAPTFTPQPTDATSTEPESTITTFTEGIVGRIQRLNPV